MKFTVKDTLTEEETKSGLDSVIKDGCLHGWCLFGCLCIEIGSIKYGDRSFSCPSSPCAVTPNPFNLSG